MRPIQLFSLITAIRPYGAHYLFYQPRSFKTIPKAISSFLVENLLVRFLTMGSSCSGAPINRYFFFLVSQKKAYKIDYQIASFFIYNFNAFQILRVTLKFIQTQINRQSRFLFITDKQTNELFQLRRLNYLFWPKFLYPSLDVLSEIEYYYTNAARATLYKLPARLRGFDCVFFCGQDYSRLNAASFASIGRATVGVCSADTRPDLFDYTLPVISTYNFTISWLISLIFLMQSSSKTF